MSEYETFNFVFKDGGDDQLAIVQCCTNGEIDSNQIYYKEDAWNIHNEVAKFVVDAGYIDDNYDRVCATTFTMPGGLFIDVFKDDERIALILLEDNDAIKGYMAIKSIAFNYERLVKLQEKHAAMFHNAPPYTKRGYTTKSLGKQKISYI